MYGLKICVGWLGIEVWAYGLRFKVWMSFCLEVYG